MILELKVTNRDSAGMYDHINENSEGLSTSA